MVNTKLNLSMTEPYVRQIYAKQGDTGRVLEIGLEDATPENGTLRILRPDGVEKTSDAISSDSPTITDGMASFESLDEAEVTSLKVGISPVQDLHGYANPWVGGAGKNKLPLPTAETKSGVTLTHNDDGTITIKGTASAIVYFDFFDGNFDSTLYAGYQFYGYPNIVNGVAFRISTSSRVAIQEFGRNGTIEDNGSGLYFAVRIAKDTALPTAGVTIYPTLVAPNESTTPFTPYENICPIYAGNGKNIMPPQNISGTSQDVTITSDNGVYTLSGTATGYGQFISPTTFWLDAGTYTLKSNKSTDDTQTTAQVRSVDGLTTYASSTNQGATFTLSQKTELKLRITANTGTPSGVVLKPQLEQGSIATTYAPYQGISIVQVGKNLWTSSWEHGVWDTSGNKGASSIVVRTSERIRVIPLQHYAIRRSVYTSYVNVRCFAKDGTYLGTGGDYITLIRGASAGATNANPMQSNEAWCVIQPNKDVYYIAFNDFSNDLNTEYMMVIGDTVPNEYVPFVAPHTYPISLGQSVYGGTLDVVGGKLTIDKVGFAPSLSILNSVTHYQSNFNSTNGIVSVRIGNAYLSDLGIDTTTATLKAKTISTLAPIFSGNAWNNTDAVGEIGVVDGLVFDYHYSTIGLSEWTTNGSTTVNAFYNTFGSSLFIVAPLATPTEVDLTPTQITTLLGTNNMWADGEISELTFDYGKLLSVLTADQTEVVGRCLGDVNFGGASTMPFALVVKPNNKEIT